MRKKIAERLAQMVRERDEARDESLNQRVTRLDDKIATLRQQLEWEEDVVTSDMIAQSEQEVTRTRAEISIMEREIEEQTQVLRQPGWLQSDKCQN